VIDLRSDTATLPSAEMRRAMMDAVVGDEQRGEDPTVYALEERVASLVGHEAAVFVPSATMANQIALKILSQPGDEVVADAFSHIFRSEVGGHAVHSGLAIKTINTADGRFGPEQLRRAVNSRTNFRTPPTRVLCIENTHNAGGGRVWSLHDVRAVISAARDLELAAHLDGARLLNACVAAGVQAYEYASEFDTVTLCLSKGLGCPLGALIAGSSELMWKARRMKQLFGGAMRQAGIVAAAGLYALDHHVERLADDHANATRLAEGLVDAGLPANPEQVETNIVLIDVGVTGIASEEALVLLREEGVLVSLGCRRDTLRAVTHMDVGREDIELAIGRTVYALGSRASRHARVSPQGDKRVSRI
jgi:threonine aldolase